MWPFKKKEKPLKLTFYTFRPDVYEYYKIQPSNKFMPKWLKSIMKMPDWRIADYKRGDAQTRTMRSCYGFMNIMKVGYMIPLWTDLKVEVEPEGETGYEYVFGDNTTRAEEHHQNQRGDFMPKEKFAHMKITSPWIAECNEPIQFYFAPNIWVQEDPTSVLFPEGVVDYYYQNATNINMMFVRKNHINTVDFTAGTPMVQVIPLTDRPIDMELKLVTKEKFDIILNKNYNVKFTGSPIERKRRCPFHKGES